ncbi:FkbM family methyltransferase [Elioraea thermophila]|uniref:FkbM family methyltransferase n=1 Tax=Elioraea thermophila TaxID=2185104 RepID=UPI00130061B8|nr:FkbM family methyltransferase [Elioraea thermophila]
MRDGDVLWGIGANVGLYALWCAKRHPGCRVVAFEPNALTYPVLVRHVIGNGVADRVQALPLALSDAPMRVETFRLYTLMQGWAGNQLEVAGAPPMWYGREAARYAVVACSADELCSRLAVPWPDHIKLDVDGIEPLILAGARDVLHRVRSVLVEVEDVHVRHHAEGAEAICRPLREAGLVEDESFRGRGSGRNRLFVRPSG